MPTHAASNQAIQQMYINGHFCYAYKFGIITNGLGIVRDITFYNKDFLQAHPDIIVEKKSDSPDEDKSLADSKALLPVLIDFSRNIHLLSQKLFLVTPPLTRSRFTNPLWRNRVSKSFYSFENKAFCWRDWLHSQWKRYSLLSSRPITTDEAWRKQISFAKQTSYHEICMSQNEMDVRQGHSKIFP